MFSADDHRYMARALELARRGLWSTDPNPRVGCVIVNQGRIVGDGWHRRAGEDHAERLALTAAGDAARGATVYVTLEPCCHHGRTPPCADALIAAGVAEVVIAMTDPNPLVAGGGIARLEAAGIRVRNGLMQDAAVALNRGFVARNRRGRPWLTVKLGVSLDGRTAMASGESQWITGPQARADVQRLRARSSAVMTGSGTILADDPALNVRLEGAERQPLRVILDSHLSIPLSARVLNDGEAVLVATAVDAEDARCEEFRQRNVELVCLPHADGRVDPAELLGWLATERECNEVLVEAGAMLCGSLLERGLVDEIVVYLAAVLLGDAARGMFHLPALTTMDQRVPLTITDLRAVGPDWRITARPVDSTEE